MLGMLEKKLEKAKVYKKKQEPPQLEPKIARPINYPAKLVSTERSQIDLGINQSACEIKLLIHPASLILKEKVKSLRKHIYYTFRELEVSDLNEICIKSLFANNYDSTSSSSNSALEIFEYNYLLTRDSEADIYNIIKDISRTYK